MKKLMAIIVAALIVFGICGCEKNTKKNIHTGKKATDAQELLIYSYKPDTFCPLLSKNDANIQTLSIIYEGLVELSDTLYPEPCLAESWSVSEDGKKWNITLRQNVVWHDGTAFGAKDVVYTVNCIKAHEESVYLYNVSNIKEIKDNGQYEIEIELHKPWANFVNLLYFPIIKNHAGEIDAASFAPNGTGPYKYEDRNEGNVFYLVKNKEWWGDQPETQTIKVAILPDNNTALYAFGSGSIDLTVAEDMNWGRFVDPVSSSYTTMSTPIFHFLGINHKNETLSFPEVRKAISYAVNREEIISEVMTGYATAATIPVHPQWFMCGKKKFETTQNNKAAKKVLQDNEWELKDGVFRKTVEDADYKTEFKILVNAENENREIIADIIKKNLEELGFRITIVNTDFEDYQASITEGNYDMFIGSYIISPDVNFDFIAGENNVFGFENEEVLAAIKGIETKYSISGIEEGYGEVIAKFEETTPVAGLFFEDKIMLHSNRIKGDIIPSYFDIYRGIESLRKEETK